MSNFVNPVGSIAKESINNVDLMHVGVVEDNDDPEQIGRCRVRIPLYEDLPVDAIPWAEPILPSFLGGNRDSVFFSVPEIGSELFVVFPTKNKREPSFIGSPVNNKYKDEEFKEDYPYSYGFKDSRGNFFKVNLKTGVVQFVHSSGTNIKISTLGEVSITGAGKTSIESALSIDIKAPNIKAIGNFGTTSGETAEVPVGPGMLTFVDGILRKHST